MLTVLAGYCAGLGAELAFCCFGAGASWVCFVNHEDDR